MASNMIAAQLSGDDLTALGLLPSPLCPAGLDELDAMPKLSARMHAAAR